MTRLGGQLDFTQPEISPGRGRVALTEEEENLFRVHAALAGVAVVQSVEGGVLHVARLNGPRPDADLARAYCWCLVPRRKLREAHDWERFCRFCMRAFVHHATSRLAFDLRKEHLE